MKYLILILTFMYVFIQCFANDKLYYPYVINYNNLTAVKPLNIKSGNVNKGKIIFKSRKTNCLSCHEAPMPTEWVFSAPGNSVSPCAHPRK